jgi:phosphoglycerate dehydrogenase-like enzyme
MALMRRTFTIARAMELGLYEGLEGTRVAGKHWLLIGAGEQVTQLIAMCIGLGVKGFTVYHDQMSRDKLKQCLRLIPAELLVAKTGLEYHVKGPDVSIVTVSGTRDLTWAIPEADIISLHVPALPANPVSQRPATERMIDRQFLCLTKRPCYLINVARGNLIQEEALIDWLRSDPTNGFAADVIDPQAERQRDPSLSVLHQTYITNSLVLDPRKKLNIVLLSHIGGSSTEDFAGVCHEVCEAFFKVLNVAIPASIRRVP